MTLELSLIISGMALAFSVFFGLATYRRNQRTDTQKDASEMTTVLIKLENISAGITEIKSELNSVKSEIKEMNHRVTIIEQSLKAAWRQIDEMKK